MYKEDGTQMTEQEIREYFQSKTSADLSPNNYDNLSLEDKLLYKSSQLEIMMRRENKAKLALELACHHIANLYYDQCKDPWFYDFDGKTIVDRSEFEEWFLKKAEECV